ncbi:MAG: tol-pal system protein YbgF [Rhodospirillaceae bacterium]|nr:tol-pal system protein YbgF [Rhodospirillaceae bacterium]
MMFQAQAPMAALTRIPVPARRLARALLALAVFACLALPAFRPAAADEVDDLRRELEQLKQQVLFLQNQIPGASAGGAAAGGGGLAAQQEVRLQQLQQQMADITGQIERVELKANDLAAQLERMQKDYEYRLGVLEGTGGLPPAGTAAPGGTTEGAISDGAGPSLTSVAPAPAGADAAQPAAPAPTGQPGVLGTLNSSAPLPQPPAGAAEEAAAKAAQQTAMPSGAVVLPGATPREQYDYATNLIQRGAYDQAEIALKSFIQQHPQDELTGNAQYWLGETYYVRNDFKSAAVAFAEGYQKYPNSQKASDNLLKLAMALGQQGQKENACVALKQLEKRYPDASANIKDRAIKAKQRYGCS